MPIYPCTKCDYVTDRKSRMDDHIASGKCKKGQLHGNIKQKEFPACNKCGDKFTTQKLLDKHIIENHTQITIKNGNNKTTNNGKINKLINKNTINTINNNNTNITINIHPVIHSYKYFDINDMSVFEQYLAFTSTVSPYVGILDNLNLNPNKPSYHNMKITNKRENYMTVYDGVKWTNATKDATLSTIMSSENNTFLKLCYKFIIFLKDDYLQDYKQSYDPKPASELFREIQESMHKNIYETTKFNNRINMIIPGEDDPIWRPLDKNFVWAEIEMILTKLDELGIHFSIIKDDSVRYIGVKHITNSIDRAMQKDPKLKPIFKKFLKQLKKVSNNNGVNNNESISTDTPSAPRNHT